MNLRSLKFKYDSDWKWKSLMQCFPWWHTESYRRRVGPDCGLWLLGLSHSFVKS